jgi:hypothetical protein
LCRPERPAGVEQRGEIVRCSVCELVQRPDRRGRFPQRLDRGRVVIVTGFTQLLDQRISFGHEPVRRRPEQRDRGRGERSHRPSIGWVRDVGRRMTPACAG